MNGWHMALQGCLLLKMSWSENSKKEEPWTAPHAAKPSRAFELERLALNALPRRPAIRRAQCRSRDPGKARERDDRC
jgi:hypothetical protein